MGNMEQNNFENQMDEKTRILIAKLEKELKIKDDEIRAKEKEINDLKNELAILKGQILNKNRKIFGNSTEKVDPNQLSLFDEAEKNSDLKAPEPEVEEITYNALSIADIMNLTIDEALEELFELKKVTAKLQKLSDLGLGYLTLGEATPSLSGGEAQRLKLASEIGKSQKNSIFIFDEPTIGLHPLDVKVLIDVFDNLIDRGATVIVIEHDLDLIANADYIIDIEIGEDYSAGEILAEGSLKEIINSKNSLTGKYLAEKELL